MLQAHQQIVEGRGTNTNLVDDQSGTGASVFVPAKPNTLFEKPLASVAAGLQMLTGNVQTAVKHCLPAVVPQHLRAAAVNVLSKPFIALQTTAIAEKQAIDKATASALQVDPSTLSTAPIRARANQLLDAADIASKAGLLQNFNLEQLAGVIEAGALDPLPAEISQAAKDRYMVMRHILRSGLQASYQLQPDVNNPVASGPDVGSAMAASQAALDALKARSADVDSVVNVLKSIVAVVAIATDLHIEPAYDLLTSGRVPSATDR